MHEAIRITLKLLYLLTFCCPFVLPAAETELQWPWWRGPISNGMGIETGKPLADTPKLAWLGTEFTKVAYGALSRGPLVGGCQSIVMHNDRIYVSYFIGSDSPVLLHGGQNATDSTGLEEKQLNNHRKVLTVGGGVGSSWGIPRASLSRVGFDPEDLERMVRLSLNIYGDDVMVCLDTKSGNKLWRTAVPGGVNFCSGTYGPHYTPTVDPSTGHVYTLSGVGRIISFDGNTGKVRWINNEGPDHEKRKARFEKAISDQKAPALLRGDKEHLIAIDGLVVCAADAYDGETGKKRWSIPGSNWYWLPWQHKGKWYMLNRGVCCVDPQTGEDLWKLSREEASATQTGVEGLAIVVSGDVMVCENAAYRISPNGRELLWRNEDIVNSGTQSSLIQRGRYYTVAVDPKLVAKGRAEGIVDRKKLVGGEHDAKAKFLISVDLKTGQDLKIHGSQPHQGVGACLTGMDGYICWATKGGDFYWLEADKVYDKDSMDKRLIQPAKVGENCDMDPVQTPILYRGQLYARGGWSVFCFDFRK